jgi:hypothetical protein
LPILRGGETEACKLTIDAELHDWLNDEASTSETWLKANIRAHLGEFVRGSPIDDLDYVKRVADRRMASRTFAHGVWSIRPSFMPQQRLFGIFAITDWCIVFTHQSRDKLAQSDLQ